MESLLNNRALALVAFFAGATAVILWRQRETESAVTARRILIPPLGMATGFGMFWLPAARIPWSWGIAAFLVGALVFSWPLTHTSRLVRVGDRIMLERSKAFLYILVGLVAVRFALRSYVEQRVTPIQTGAIFFTLAFGMILRWRTAMFLEYRRLR
jgi:membrane protein CcdC involved in cytochrome C biogenesis